MKKAIKFIKNNILGFLVGLLLCLNGVIIAENMLSSEQVSYSGSKTEQTTVKGTLDQLFDAVDINERLGSTDISSIGDGTVTGGINKLNSILNTYEMLGQSSGTDETPIVVDLSKYKLIYVELSYAATNVVSVNTMPVGRFISMNQLELYHNINCLGYVKNTSINGFTLQSNETNFFVRVYGVIG